ncbi:hypothetical protein DSO57_1038574 [Entomophthora muscae]|uniref:Uncharacterized protein n=1 Tax=Entomophthora muscae TaxID=34485 RepID=A0ACC2T9C0_9FUNG|nr:hypothetical protein DSO57_1038574 [Entomophthora muscae]
MEAQNLESQTAESQSHEPKNVKQKTGTQTPQKGTPNPQKKLKPWKLNAMETFRLPQTAVLLVDRMNSRTLTQRAVSFGLSFVSPSASSAATACVIKSAKSA